MPLHEGVWNGSLLPVNTDLCLLSFLPGPSQGLLSPDKTEMETSHQAQLAGAEQLSWNKAQCAAKQDTPTTFPRDGGHPSLSNDTLA